MVKCTVCGSFRFYVAIREAVEVFEEAGVEVLSPKKSRVTNPGERFLRLESDDAGANPSDLELDHLDAIGESDFVYLVAPGGYVGSAVSFEVGWASNGKIPIYASELPGHEEQDLLEQLDYAFVQYGVRGVLSPAGVVRALKDGCLKLAPAPLDDP